MCEIRLSSGSLSATVRVIIRAIRGSLRCKSLRSCYSPITDRLYGYTTADVMGPTDTGSEVSIDEVICQLQCISGRKKEGKEKSSKKDNNRQLENLPYTEALPTRGE